MASIVPRVRWDGTTAFSVRWRDKRIGRQPRVTVQSEQEAESLALYLNDNGQMPTQTSPGARPAKPGVPTVADIVQHHIDLLVRPSPGAIGTYQRILDLRIRNMMGHIPVDEFGYVDIMRWLKDLTAKGAAPKSIYNMHGLLSAAMNTAELLGYISRNPCRGVPLPAVERAEDAAMFLTVMTGTRFGEATAVRVDDIDLVSRPPTVRINKAWKRDGQSRYYLGPTKTGAGKRTIGLNPALAKLLIPIVAGRPGPDLLFDG